MKRHHPGGDRSDEGYTGKRGAHQGAPHRGPPALRYAFKLLCPEALAAHLLRSQKESGRPQVQTIEEETHAKLNFSRRGELYPDTDLRILVVSATETRKVQAAITLLVDEVVRLANSVPEDFKARSGFRMFCALGKESAGNVIGQKGQRIQALRKDIGAQIKIDSAVYEGHQLVTIEGGRDQLLNVFDVLAEAVNKDVEAPWFAEWVRQKTFDGAGNGRSWPSEPPRTGRIGHGGDDTIFVGGLSQSVRAAHLETHFARFGEILEADVITDHTSGRSKGFGFVAFADAAAVEECLQFAHEHRLDGKVVEVKRYGEKGDERARDDHHSSWNSNDAWRGGDRPQPSSAGPSWRGATPTRNAHQGAGRDLEWFASIIQRVNPEYLGYEYSIQCCIPDQKCGAVLGHRGQHIREVEKKTGAKLDLQKKEDVSEQDLGRRQLSMEGPLLSVYAAHMLLMRTYNDEEAKWQRKGEQRKGNRDGGNEDRRDNRRGDDLDIVEMQKQIEKLQAQLQGR